jgi:hypothetical protein
MSAPAIVGAGGCGMPPSPMRCRANWRALSKRMNCITRLATKVKHDKAGRSRWGAGRVGVARSASLAVAITGLHQDPCKNGHRDKVCYAT